MRRAIRTSLPCKYGSPVGLCCAYGLLPPAIGIANTRAALFWGTIILDLQDFLRNEKQLARTVAHLKFLLQSAKILEALSIVDPEKHKQETESLLRIPDSFKKIVVVKEYLKPWRDEKGIVYVGVEQFLLDEGLLVG